MSSRYRSTLGEVLGASQLIEAARQRIARAAEVTPAQRASLTLTDAKLVELQAQLEAAFFSPAPAEQELEPQQPADQTPPANPAAG